MQGKLINTRSGTEHKLLQYPRPKRVVRSYSIFFVNGKKCEVVVTRGEKYCYLTIEGIDFYINGLLEADGKYKVILDKTPQQ